MLPCIFPHRLLLLSLSEKPTVVITAPIPLSKMADSLLFRAVEEIRRMGDPEYWEKELNIMQAGEEGRHM